MPRRRAIAAVVVVAGLAAACAGTGINQGDLNLVSLEEEWRLGSQLEEDLAGRLDLVGDRAAVSFVQRLGERLVSQSHLAGRPWKFHIVRDPSINAFNVPGGHVYVHTGLFDAADDVAEFCGVLAHEVAHGVARHGTEQLTRSYGLQLLAGLALGESPSTLESLGTQIAGAGALARFGRDAEREADRLGLRLMHGAGYDPLGMARIFEELLAQRQRRPGAVEQFFSTHPLTEARIADVRRHAAELAPLPDPIRHDPEYRRIRRRLTG